MCHPSRRPFRSLAGAVVCALVLAACKDSSSGPSTSQLVSPFVERKIVGDNAAALATVTDANLLNPWGFAFTATGIMWASDDAAGLSTVYDTAGTKQALVVTIPSHAGATGGKPTGIVNNTTADFVIPTSTASCPSR